MLKNLKDLETHVRLAFRDVRTDEELLDSGRPPKSITVQRSNPVSKKLTSGLNAVKKKGGGLFGKFKKFVVSTAAKAALGPVGYAAFKVIDGKFNVTGRIAGAIGSKLGKKSISSIGKLADTIGLGVKVVEETDPNKIRRPLKEGLSSSASAAAKSLGETYAASITSSLITGIPLASPLPSLPREFKTAASLVKSPRFWNPTKSAFTLPPDQVAQAEKAIIHLPVSNENAVLFPQLGLLEDELMYRLTLLAENVYLPTQNFALTANIGRLTILEGFRAEHTKVSPHERGEAMDFTVGDGSLQHARACFTLAQWMRDHIAYDQLILCFSPIQQGQVWIHVTFKPDNRRRQVLTKAFNDAFMDGLHLYGPYTNAQHKAEETAHTKEINDNADKFMSVLTARQARLTPSSVTSAPTSGTDTTGATMTSPITGAVYNCDECFVVYPRNDHPKKEEILELAFQAERILLNKNITFKSESEMETILAQALAGSTTAQLEYAIQKQKLALITVSVARQLFKQYPTIGLYTSGTSTDVSYDMTNSYFNFYGKLMPEGTVEVPNAVQFAYDTILFSKNGPQFQFLSTGTRNIIGAGTTSITSTGAFITDTCYVRSEWELKWRHPYDGTVSNYATTTSGAKLQTTPDGCKISVVT